MKNFLFLTALFFIVIGFNSFAQSAIDYYDSGTAKEKEDDHYGAIADFTKAILINPNYSDAYFSRGLVKDILKDYYAAEQDFTKIIEIDPNFTMAYYERAIERRDHLNDPAGASADCSKAEQLAKSDPKAALFIKFWPCR